VAIALQHADRENFVNEFFGFWHRPNITLGSCRVATPTVLQSHRLPLGRLVLARTKPHRLKPVLLERGRDRFCYDAAMMLEDCD
jgi:hypothetical protein